MNSRKLLARLAARLVEGAGAPRRSHLSRRPTFFEPLEDRCLLSVDPWPSLAGSGDAGGLPAKLEAVQAALVDFQGADLSGKDGTLANAGYELALLRREHEFASAKGAAFAASNPLLQVVGDFVAIDVGIEDAAAARVGLEALGMQVTGEAQYVMSGLLPIKAIAEAVDVPGVRFLSPAYRPRVNVGLVTSQGDRAMDSDELRDVLGFDGTGVTVGILSDSFNTSGNGSYADDVASGDLPGPENPLGRTTPVDILYDYADPNPDTVAEGDPTDEGRAMAQIVHDVAPGASLAFATAVGGESTFAKHIKDLRKAGAHVIVDDIIYFKEPFFQDGLVAQAVDQVVGDGAAYFSAAGNYADQSYESVWRPGKIRAPESIVSAPDCPSFLGGITFAFNPGAEDGDRQRFKLDYGDSIRISLQWDSPFYSVSGGDGSPNDLDAYVLDGAGTQVLMAAISPNSYGDAVEVFEFTNTTYTTTTFSLMIVSRTAATPGYIKYVNFADSRSTMHDVLYATHSGTIVGHANAAGAEAVGAASYRKTPAFGTSPPVLESFSSVGTTPILFDTAGNRLPTPVLRLNKPGLVAPDNVATTFFGAFSGTSAAAPHAAAVAALMLEARPGIAPGTVYAIMENTAIDMGEPGFDNRTGHGLIDAAGATVAVAMDPQVGLLVAPTVTTTGQTSYLFSVAYSDDEAIDVSSLGNADIRVTGPDGFSQLATFVAVDNATDGTPRVATYRITPPGGSWDAADKGTYTLAMESAAVADIYGIPVLAGKLGTFRVLPAVLYVDGDARGRNNGTAWSDAFTRLEEALAASADADEIWVAAGTYKPTNLADRTRSFSLKSGVSVYGGFAGNEASLDQRDWTANPTILSGDIGIPSQTADNSYHVVYAAGVVDATLDGFTITGGNASAAVGATSGGGMFVAGSWLTIANCVFVANAAAYGGGGLCSDGSSPRLLNCTFRENSVGFSGTGGGMYNYNSTPTLMGVTFSGNTAATFQGGGMFNHTSTPSLTNVVFGGNVAVDGGAMFNYASSPVLLNVTISGNVAGSTGGAIANSANSRPRLINSVVWGNSALVSPEIDDASGSATKVACSAIAGGWAGFGNLNSNPRFADPLGGDFHLQTGSPAIDSASRLRATPVDRDGGPRPVDGNADGVARYDMGAYEHPVLVPSGCLMLYDPGESVFYLRRSITSGTADSVFGFGQPGAHWKTLVGDWDGDGNSGAGLYDPASSTFYLTNAWTSGYAECTFGYGVPGAGWVPLVGDWDGDGRAGVGLYNPHRSTFYLSNTLQTGVAEYTVSFGAPNAGWIPLTGDWDGDGAEGVALFDPKTSTFYLTNALFTGMAEHTFGFGAPNAGWQPLVGDWDGDRADGVGLFDAHASVFYLTSALVSGFAEDVFGYGEPDGGWKPLVGDWDGDTRAGLGLYDPETSTFYLTNSLRAGVAEHTVAFGAPGAGWEPLAGCCTPESAKATVPAAAAVDRVDLAAVVSQQLGSAWSFHEADADTSGLLSMDIAPNLAVDLALQGL